MTIRHIAFRADVAVTIGTRDFTSITSWSLEKHAKDIDVEQKEGFVYFYPMKDGKRTGRRKKLPMSSISYIDEEDSPKVKA